MTSFIHFADAHINNIVTGRVNGGIPIRVLDILHNFDMLIDYALEQSVDYVLFAGDMYNNSNPANHYRTMVQSRIMKLAQANIKVILVPGNHDMTKSHIKDHALSEFRQLAPNNVYLVDRPDTLYFDDLVITCIPWQYDEFTFVPPIIDQSPHICVAHCSITGAIFESGSEVSGEMTLGKEFILQDDYFAVFDYAALGHIHKAQTIGNTVYPGSMEQLTWGEAKDGSIHSFVHWIDNDWITIPYYTRPRQFIIIDLDSDYQLPNPDSETQYELTFTSNDPLSTLPNLQHFMNVAFSTKIKDLRLKPKRYGNTPVDFEYATPTAQLKTWFEMEGLDFDTNMEELWHDIMSSV